MIVRVFELTVSNKLKEDTLFLWLIPMVFKHTRRQLKMKNILIHTARITNKQMSLTTVNITIYQHTKNKDDLIH